MPSTILHENANYYYHCWSSALCSVPTEQNTDHNLAALKSEAKTLHCVKRGMGDSRDRHRVHPLWSMNLVLHHYIM